MCIIDGHRPQKPRYACKFFVGLVVSLSKYPALCYGLELLVQFMTPKEFTQWFNLARALDLVVSSRSVNGVLYVYTDHGYAKPWHVFATEYPLERLQAMVDRARQVRSLPSEPGSLSTSA